MHVTNFTPGFFSTRLNGHSAGTQYDQVTALIGVTLDGARLNLASPFTPSVGEEFDILHDASPFPVSGTFEDIPEGQVVSADGQYFTITYQGGTTGKDVVLTAIDAPVASVQVNDGSAQRSEVRSITITYSTLVKFMGDASLGFNLTHLTDNKNVILIANTSTNGSGHTAVTLTFFGDETDAISMVGNANSVPGPSLADGLYSLSTGNYHSPTDTSGGSGLHLFRLFGDADGNGVVDSTDLGQFRSTYNYSIGSAEYLYYFDANNDGVVDSFDLGQFSSRFNSNVFGM